MSLLLRARRRVAPPGPIENHQSKNPNFGATDQYWSTWRRRIAYVTGACIIVLVTALFVYGPWLQITDIHVTGTRLLDPNSIQQAVTNELDQRSWLIIPNRTLWTLSTTSLQRTLEKQIRQRLSIESIVIRKLPPHRIEVKITERTPIGTWTNGTSFGSIDRQGIIIELRAVADPQLPIIRDEAARIFAADGKVVKPEVVLAITVLRGYLHEAKMELGEFIIPDPICPVVQVVPEVLVPTNSVLNTNTTSDIKNTNVALKPNINLQIPALQPRPCDQDALRFSSQEIHVQLLDGPRVLFDRQSNLLQAVQALKRVLSEQHTVSPKTIDVRFGDQVYIQ